MSAVLFLVVFLLTLFAMPRPAAAAWTAQTGARGWCTPAGSGTEECFGDPQSACNRQFEVYAGSRELHAYADTPYWWSKRCQWTKALGEALPTAVTFKCETSYVRAATGLCTRSNENFQSRDCGCPPNGGGTVSPETPKPISILDGAKSFTDIDFQTADSGLVVRRHYSSRPAGASGNTLITSPLGFANWRWALGMELHLGDDWSTGVAGLATPRGGHYTFSKSGVAMIPTTSTAYPVKQTDYALEFVGTWPGTLATVRSAKSSWIVRDAEDRTWYLETHLNPSTGDFDTARPVRIVEPSGLETALQYSANGALFSATDSYGRTLTFDWIYVEDVPRAISQIQLPDGTTLNYTFESLSALPTAPPERLVSVERRQGATVLDKTSYDYADARFPTFVTGIRDRDNALRWSVVYDDLGRATSSSGPGGVDAFAVAYGAAGSTFTRTVTTPLGKPVTYTFERTSANYNIKLASIAQGATANSPASSESKTYDGNLYLGSETDAEGRVTGFIRDAKGRPTTIVEAQGTPLARTSTLTWHSVRNELTEIAEPQRTTATTLTSGTSAVAPPAPTYVTSQAYPYSGSAATLTAPAGVTSATVELWGGAGGNGNLAAGAWSGAGGYIRATFAVSPGAVLTFEVAGGGQGAIRDADGGLGGWPDGGAGGKGNGGTGGGGGSSRFYIDGVLKAVAGGGGGSGGYGSYGSAGAGGGPSAQAAEGLGGTGGSQSAGGVDSSQATDINKTGRSVLSFPGAQRLGGWGASNGTNTTATSDDGGGGGGGYWGGGGGGGSSTGRSDSGGGGSSWVDPAATGVINQQGYRRSPFSTPAGLPTIATGVNSQTNGVAVAGGDGYATVGLK